MPPRVVLAVRSRFIPSGLQYSPRRAAPDSDIPGFWLALLVIEFPAIYIPGVISLVGTLRSKFVAGPAFLMTKLFLGLALVSVFIAGNFTITFANNNDLGWRAVLPAVFISTIFAATGLSRWLSARAPLAVGIALLLLLLSLPKSFELAAGYARGSPSVSDQTFAITPAMWDAVRRHTTPAERVANNPLFMKDLTPWPVNISWALFADRRSCFAGSELALLTSLPRNDVRENRRSIPARLRRQGECGRRAGLGEALSVPRGDTHVIGRSLAARSVCRQQFL